MGENFQTNFVQKIRTYVLSSVYFFPENGAVNERMWESMVEPDWPHTDNVGKCGGAGLATYTVYNAG